MLDHKAVLIGLDQSSLQHDYLVHYEKLFAEREDIKNVALVGDSGLAVKAARLMAECYPQIQFCLLTSKHKSQKNFQNSPLEIVQYQNIDDLVFTLMVRDSFDICIEHSDNTRSNKNILFASIFPFLRKNGIYFIEDVHSVFIDKFNDGSNSIIDLLNQLMHDKIFNQYNPKLFLAEILPQLVESVENFGKLIRINRSHFPILLKIQGLIAPQFFKHRPDMVKKYQVIYPKTSYQSGCKVTTNRDEFKHMAYMPSEMPVLEIGLREYNSVICIPGQIPVKNGFMLPEYQRRTMHLGHNNKNNKNNTKFYAEDHERVTQTLPKHFLKGTYLYLDNEYDSHFGHMLTEFISKLWAWEIFQEQYPNGKVIIGALSGEIYPLVKHVLQAYGIPDERIIALNTPMIVEHLICPSQLYQIGNYVSQEVAKTWDKLTAYFLGQADENSPTYSKIFVSRRDKGRACRNAQEVESLFSENGYQVVYPEDFGFAEQVKLFNAADEIAGFGGSATINAIFSKNNVRKIIIQSDTYSANNDYLISSVKKGELIICYCDAEIPYKGYWSIQAFMSPYTCTLKELEYLQDVI